MDPEEQQLNTHEDAVDQAAAQVDFLTNQQTVVAGEGNRTDDELTDDKIKEEKEKVEKKEGSVAPEATVEESPSMPPLPMETTRNRVLRSGGPGGPEVLADLLPHSTKAQGATSTSLSPIGISSITASAGNTTTTFLPSSSTSTNNTTSSS